MASRPDNRSFSAQKRPQPLNRPDLRRARHPVEAGSRLQMHDVDDPSDPAAIIAGLSPLYYTTQEPILYQANNGGPQRPRIQILDDTLIQ